MDNDTSKKSFWTTLPGILTAAATLIVAVTGLITALFGTGVLRNDGPPPTSIATSTSLSPVPTTAADTPEPVDRTPIGTSSGSGNLAECLDVSPGKFPTMEAGLRDFPLIEAEQAAEGPVAIEFTDLGMPIGAVKFATFLFGENTFFRIEAMVNSGCQPLSEYIPLGGARDRNTLQNWNEMCMRLGDNFYLLGLGWDTETPITANFTKLSPVSDPPSSACQEAIPGAPN